MKRTLTIVISSIVFLVVSNIYYYRDTYNWQINTHQKILEKDLSTCFEMLSNYFLEAETSVLLMLNENELGGLFNLKPQNKDIQKRIELLFKRYNTVLHKLEVFDTNGNYYALSNDPNENLITTFGRGERKEEFKASVVLHPEKNTITYTQPIFGDAHILGYVVFSIDLKQFYRDTFRNFYIEDHQFQWVTTPQNEIVYAPLPKLQFNGDNPFSTINVSHKGSAIIHQLKSNGKIFKVISVARYIPTSNAGFILVFSMPVYPITYSIVQNFSLVALISFFVILLIIIAFYQHILKNRKSEQRVSQSESALNKILHYLPFGVILTDTNKQIKLVNKAILTMLDLEDEDILLNQTASNNILFARKKLVQIVEISKSSNKYIINRGSDKQQIIVSEKIAFFNHNVEYYIYYFIEVSNAQLPQQHNKSDKAKTTFVANISHELRTPLNGIIGMTDILLTTDSLQESNKEMLKVVKRSADTLLALINDILDFSKIEAGKLEVESIPTDIATEINQTIESFHNIAKERKIKLSVQCDTELPSDFLCDPLRLKQILNNLISNALKFTPEGEVRLLIHQTTALNGNPALAFTISDTGIGIKKEKLKTIFNAFAQEDESTTRKFGGTGLGTSISKNLVTLMGGEIWANSPSSISTNPQYPGADFCFTLPFVTHRTKKELDFSYILSWTQINALIITDETMQVQHMIKTLLALGINHRVMAPSQETIVLLAEKPTFQLLIIDQRPDFNGIDFLQQLYSYNLHNQFLILLQSSDYETMNTGISKKLGADIYVRKPVKLSHLRHFILRHFPSIMSQASMAGKVVPDNIKILVAEDNLFNQKVAQSLFRKIGYEIDLANNGREAVEKFKQNKYQIIFMDLMMPELDGFRATKKLKRYDETCPIIAMTVDNDPTQRKLALQSGMDDFIVKPAQKEEIIRIITKWCSH